MKKISYREMWSIAFAFDSLLKQNGSGRMELKGRL
jgi:hypothetical protein